MRWPSRKATRAEIAQRGREGAFFMTRARAVDHAVHIASNWEKFTRDQADALTLCIGHDPSGCYFVHWQLGEPP